MTQATDDEDMSISISKNRRWLEIIAVVVTALGKFVFMDLLAWRLPFIITVTSGWSIYLFIRAKYVKGIFKHWGLASKNFREATFLVLPFMALSIISCFIVGYWQGSINLTWHIFPILILYPFWGTLQQLLLMAFVAGNLQGLQHKRLTNVAIVIITACLFAIIHLPHYWLVFGTFLLALFYGYVYLKVPNLFVLGLLHGWLGALFFYTVVDRDPFEEVFGIFFN